MRVDPMSNRRRPALATLPSRSPRGPGRARWVVGLILVGIVFAVLRGVAVVAAPERAVTPVLTPRVVVVGVAGRFQLTDTDREVLNAHLDDAQAGTISTRPRYVGDCAAAGWTTLGAGRRAAVDGRCDPAVSQDGPTWRVTDWPGRVAAAAARRGDARLGTLAASVPGCVAAVGPGAALAATRPDGTVAAYRTVPGFIDAGMPLTCPITLIDPGAIDFQVIAELARRDEVTLIVTGIGPAPGSDDPSLGVFYRLQSGAPGLVTSASTRRTGVVTVTDLTRTLIDFGRGPDGAVPLDVDGSPLASDQSTLTLPRIEAAISEAAALSDAAPVGYLSLAAGGSLLFGLLLVGVWRRRWILPERVLTLGSVLLAGMMLTGRCRGPVRVTRAGGQRHRLGLDHRPHLRRDRAVPGDPGAGRGGRSGPHHGGVHRRRGPRRADGGGVAAQLAAGLRAALVRLRQRHLRGVRQRRPAARRLARERIPSSRAAGAAVAAVAVIGLGMVICEGWPSMGTDFGGVIALTPAVLWWCLTLSGAR